VAANIQEAIDTCANFIGLASGTVAPPNDVPSRMTNWNNLMFLVPASFPAPGDFWDRVNLEQRSVFDWAVPSVAANTQIQTIGNSPYAGNLAINVVLRTLLAAQFAATQGWITANQLTSVVNAWNTAWE